MKNYKDKFPLALESINFPVHYDTGSIVDSKNNVVLQIIHRYGDLQEQMGEMFVELLNEQKSIIDYDNRFMEVFVITEKLKPFLSEASLKIISNTVSIENLNPDRESIDPHVCFIGVTTSISLMKLEDLDKRTHNDIPDYMYEKLAKMFNKAVDEGIVIEGVLYQPFAMKLARLSPIERYMLCISTVTKVPLKELIEMNPYFIKEGALGKNLEDIKE